MREEEWMKGKLCGVALMHMYHSVSYEKASGFGV